MGDFFKFLERMKKDRLNENQDLSSLGEFSGGNDAPPQAPPGMDGNMPDPNASMPQDADNANPDEGAIGPDDDGNESNLSPAEGGSDFEKGFSQIKKLSELIDSLKQQDEDKGSEFEQLVQQMKNLLKSFDGAEEFADDEGEDDGDQHDTDDDQGSDTPQATNDGMDAGVPKMDGDIPGGDDQMAMQSPMNPSSSYVQ